jgi:large subunit ribosomal protein L4
VRRSAQRSAVLWHVQNGSAYYIDGNDFDTLAKTKQVAEILENIGEGGKVTLVLSEGSSVWKSARNLPLVSVVRPTGVNVRDLVHNQYLVFSASALDAYKKLLTVHTAEADDASDAAEGEGKE